MGNYVDKVTAPSWVWGIGQLAQDGSDLTQSLVEQKYSESLSNASDLLELMVGSNGDGGMLGAMEASITEYVSPAVNAVNLIIPDMSSDIAERPVLDYDDLDTNFPTFDTAAPVFGTLPTVDMSELSDATAPDEITAAVNWVATVHSSPIFTDLVTKLIADLNGSTGLDATIEQEIWDRASYRLALEEDKELIEMEEFFSAKGFELPTGAENGALIEFVGKKNLSRADLTGKISIEQAELAQKNTHFAIEACNILEAMLREDTNKTNDRTLDFAKSVAANEIQLYAENIRGYLAKLEGDKNYVSLQVENLKAVVAREKGLADLYIAESQAYATKIDAIAKRNSAITDVFVAENSGYDSETKAIAEQHKAEVAEWTLKLQNSEMQLRAAIAKAENSLGGYTSEYNMRQSIASDMAKFVSQMAASFAGSVNMSAGLTHATGRRYDESYTHGETRSIGTGISNTLGETHPYKETV